MRNHIVIKFIAVLLCAVTLVGAAGSAAGIFALTEMDLYDKDIDQVYMEQIHREGQSMAYDRALLYASSTLGGCPMPMVEEMYYHANSSAFNSLYYGYALKDAEGNVLESKDFPAGSDVTTYSFRVTGQYMHLVDTVTASEQEQLLQEEAGEQQHQEAMAANAVLINEIPPEGAVLTEIHISSADSSNGASGGTLGTVFCNQNGQVILRCPGWDLGPDQVATAIALHDHSGRLIYEASAEDGIGLITYDTETGDMIFTSFYMSRTPAAEAAMPETAAGTEAPTEVTVPETAPEEAEAVESTAAAETEAEAAEDSEETKSEATEAVSEETAEQTNAEEKKAEEQESEEKKSEEKKSDENKSEKETVEETTSAEETAEKKDQKNSSEETEASSEAEAAPAKEDSEGEPAEDGTEATEETVVPTVPETVPEETIPEETIPEEPEPVLINGKPLDSYQINRMEYYDSETGKRTIARYVYVPMPEMTLELQVVPGVLRNESVYTVMRMVRAFRGYLFPALGLCLLMFAVCAVYLCCAAGRKPKTDEVRASGLNRIPLDLYGFLMVMGVGCLGVAIAEGGDYLLRQNVMVGCAFIAAMALLASLLIVGFLFASVAQIKTPGGFWWRNSLVGWCLKLCGWFFRESLRFCVRLEEWASRKGWPLLVRLCKWVWGLIASLARWVWNTLARFLGWMQRSFDRFLSLLPVTWQWLLAGCAMVMLTVISLAVGSLFLFWLSILLMFTLVIYGAHCFGELLQTTKKMNKGDLNSKADDKLMVGAFKEFAGDLNDLAGVAIVAAQKQLKSERMKTELITNVSHDIKTPLTSIINYVDLLQKPHTEEEQQQYLEVLDRQSQRLKKLIDDLMDMSKASTGNMAVDITLLDAVESVNQALGEFGDKLDRAQLTPVFRHTEESVPMMADGRLVWRVLSNLLSNAVKYAMPGTRLYIDLMSLENKVVISLKNISREELNVDAEELMERFVRGDGSRNTEGSGLGLNIAKSLMELQKGQLQLLVDGDLFKVTLIFPGL